MHQIAQYLRAVLYARFSTDQQREASIDDQYRACERTAVGANLRIVGRFEDRGISGGTAERPGYQALLAAARAGDFDVIVTEDISRLWRSMSEFGPRSAELSDLGVHLLTVVGDDTRRDGYGLILGIKSAIAEHQRREISYRTRRGLEGLALAGKSTGGRCYGYRDGVISPGEASMVRYIFEVAATGASLAHIASLLTNVPGPRGGRWNRSTIHAILRNSRYTGAVVWGATESKGGARDSRLKRRVERPDGPVVARRDESLRIVTDELFAAAQAA